MGHENRDAPQEGGVKQEDALVLQERAAQRMGSAAAATADDDYYDYGSMDFFPPGDDDECRFLCLDLETSLAVAGLAGVAVCIYGAVRFLARNLPHLLLLLYRPSPPGRLASPSPPPLPTSATDHPHGPHLIPAIQKKPPCSPLGGNYGDIPAYTCSIDRGRACICCVIS
uniref:Uncharacterized protein n=1 Tax=Leersia perrieri TaxID=77586 RepID=A0A0D9X647_9ORYZ